MCKFFWGKPVRNIDSGPAGTELNDKYWPPDASLVSDRVLKHRETVHFQQRISVIYLTKSLAVTKQRRTRIGRKQSQLASQGGRA